MSYKPGEFSELSIRNGMKEWIEERQDICEDPKIYDELPSEIKFTLDTWIATHIDATKRRCPEHSSSALKTAFHRETGCYIYTGVFNGAMLRAGYQPVNPRETYWHFKVNVLP